MGLLKNRADQKGLKFDVVFDSAIPESITTSALRLRQILFNVIGNALKFTEHGSILVTIGMTTDGRLSVTTHDTGPGLTSEQRERIFLPFGQADSSVTRKYGGSGLGLILSKHLAEALGGDVELTESRPGEGSTFTVTIACGDIHDTPMVKSLGDSDWWRPRLDTKASEPSKNLSGLRVLLVEDSPDIREVLTIFIKSGGATVVTAQNGVEAVEIAKSGADLVWGGGQISMMGAVARGARERGAKTFGVIPEKLVTVEFEDPETTEMFIVSNMRTRKAKIEEISDAFIMLPGGIGTLEEFFEIWVGRKLGYHSKPVVVCDPYGSFTLLQSALDYLSEEEFIGAPSNELVAWCRDIPSAIRACSS